MAESRRGSGGQDGLDLQVEGDLVSDHHAAVLHGGVEVDVEVAPVELASTGEPGPGAAERVGAEAVQLQDQRHAPGDALEREIAVEHVIAVLEPCASRAVGHRRVGLDLEEVGGPDVLSTLLAGVPDRMPGAVTRRRRATRARREDPPRLLRDPGAPVRDARPGAADDAAGRGIDFEQEPAVARRGAAGATRLGPEDELPHGPARSDRAAHRRGLRLPRRRGAPACRAAPAPPDPPPPPRAYRAAAPAPRGSRPR